MDIIKGQSNREAIKYLTQKKNEISDAEIAHLRNYYMHTKLAPKFLKGKKLIPIKSPKLEKMETRIRRPWRRLHSLLYSSKPGISK